MAVTDVTIWKFHNAPTELRRLVPEMYSDGWLAFVHQCSSETVTPWLVAHCRESGFSVVRRDTEGGVLLAVCRQQV